MPQNPYIHSRTEDEFAAPEYPESASGYAAPILTDAPYNNEFGWAPTLRLSPEGVPDASRYRYDPAHDRHPVDQQEFYRRIDADDARQHSVEHVETMPHESGLVGSPDPRRGFLRWAPNPRSVPPPESRVTSDLNPVMYFFTRPFSVGYARRFNGMHFSMADHRREYEILGMAPAKTRRNTYRIEPAPWDADIVDMPPPDPVNNVEPAPGIRVDYGSRAWRLT